MQGSGSSAPTGLAKNSFLTQLKLLKTSNNTASSAGSSMGASGAMGNSGSSGSGSSGTSGTGTSVWDMKPNLTISDIEQKGSNGFKSEYIKKINNIATAFLGSSGLLEIIK